LIQNGLARREIKESVSGSHNSWILTLYKDRIISIFVFGGSDNNL